MKTIITGSLLFLISVFAFGQLEKSRPVSAVTGSHDVHPEEYRALSEALHPLMEKYDVSYYRFDLEASDTTAYLEGSVTIGARSLTEVDTFAFELVPYYSIDSVIISGTNTPFIRDGDLVKVIPETGISASDFFSGIVYYRGELPRAIQNTDFGICNNRAYGTTYTLSEPFFAKYWFPCKQDLTDKADSVILNIVTDSALSVGSNGLLTRIVPLANGKVRHEWRSYYPIAYYLISLSISDYLEYSYFTPLPGTQDSVLIQNYLYDSASLDYYKYYLDLTGELVGVFSDLYGPYPFAAEKYGHCMAPFPGGMEHQTMSTMVGFDYELVAHELAHQWFGDLVTCSSWQDIWINEGFATYSPLLAEEYQTGEFPVYILHEYVDELLATATTGSVYIPASELEGDFADFDRLYDLSWRIFSWPLSYLKGAVILHMLRYELNDDDVFFDILKTFLQEHRYETASGNDFRMIAEAVSGRNLDYFFDQWFYGEGYPVFRIRWHQENDTLLIESRQGPSVPGNEFFRITMDYRISLADGETTLRLEQTEATQVFSIPVSGTVLDVDVNPFSNALARIAEVSEYYGPATNLNPIRSEGFFEFFPNPAKNLIQLRFRGYDSYRVTITDATGKLMSSEHVEGDSGQMSVAGLEAGIYCISVNGNNRVETSWLIIQ